MDTHFILILVVTLAALSFYIQQKHQQKEGYRPGIGGPATRTMSSKPSSKPASSRGIARVMPSSSSSASSSRSTRTTRKPNRQPPLPSEPTEGYTLQTGWGRRGMPYINIYNKNVNKNGGYGYGGYPFASYASDGWYRTNPYTYASYYPPSMYPGLYGLPPSDCFGPQGSYYGGYCPYRQPQTMCYQTLSTFDAFGPYGSSVAGKQQWIDYAGRNGYSNVSLAKNSVVNDHAVLGYLGQCDFWSSTPPSNGYLTYDTSGYNY